MKISCVNLGCKVNQYEIDSLVCTLRDRGYDVTTELEYADVYIVNTCAVTSEAEKKSRQFVAKICKLNKEAKILICGCASQNNAEQFSTKPNVNVVIGNMGKAALVDYIDKYYVEIKDFDHKNYEDNLFVSRCDRIRAYVKIQDGCNNFCNYCLIPYLRGRSRSRNIDSILKEVDTLSKCVKEIVLTGIDMSDYRIDGERALDKLFERLIDVPVRLRISSLEVNVVTRELLEVLSKINNFCPHFHLSLQNGSNKVLKEMNRHYTSEQYLEKVELIRSYFPNAGITTDLIVGYPTENDKDFKDSLNFVKKVAFSQVHFFAYSSREGTVASKLPQINGSIIKQRELALKPVVNDLKRAFIERNRGSMLKVLVEEKVGDHFVGYSENYIRCYIKSASDIVNQVVNVKVTTEYLDGCIAEIIE